MKPTTKYVAFDVHQAITVASVRDDRRAGARPERPGDVDATDRAQPPRSADPIMVSGRHCW